MVKKNKNYPLLGLVRQGSVKAMVLLEVVAVMEVSQVSRENLFDAQLIFRFRFRIFFR